MSSARYLVSASPLTEMSAAVAENCTFRLQYRRTRAFQTVDTKRGVGDLPQNPPRNWRQLGLWPRVGFSGGEKTPETGTFLAYI